MKLIYQLDFVDLKLMRMFEIVFDWLNENDFFFRSALEAFIRAKYEQRKWIAKEWIPPEIKVSSDVSVVLFFFRFCLLWKPNGKYQIAYKSIFFLVDWIRNEYTTSRNYIWSGTGNRFC